MYKLGTFKFYFPVDIFDHVTSLARASRSSVDCRRTGGGATSLVCHGGYSHVVAAPSFRPLHWRHYLEINSA